MPLSKSVKLRPPRPVSLSGVKLAGKEVPQGPVRLFGCMPSTQSDGVHSKVVIGFKDTIFIPIETSGDGEINVKSPIQMKVYEP